MARKHSVISLFPTLQSRFSVHFAARPKQNKPSNLLPFILVQPYYSDVFIRRGAPASDASTLTTKASLYFENNEPKSAAVICSIPIIRRLIELQGAEGTRRRRRRRIRNGAPAGGFCSRLQKVARLKDGGVSRGKPLCKHDAGRNSPALRGCRLMKLLISFRKCFNLLGGDVICNNKVSYTQNGVSREAGWHGFSARFH